MTKFAVVLAFLGLVASPATAADIYGGSTKDAPAGVTVDAPAKHSWTQVFVGLNGACETGTTETNVDVTGSDGDGPPQTFNLINFKGIGSSGCSAAPFIGADYQIPSSRLVIGVEGEYRWSNDKSSVSVFNGALTGDASIDSSWVLSGRFGALVWADTLIYGRIGFGQADGSWSGAEHNSDGSTFASAHGDLPTFSTIMYGAGIETRFWDGQAALRLEYRHIDFSKEEAFSIGDAANGIRGTIQPSFDQGLIGISYRFGR